MALVYSLKKRELLLLDFDVFRNMDITSKALLEMNNSNLKARLGEVAWCIDKVYLLDSEAAIPHVANAILCENKIN